MKTSPLPWRRGLGNNCDRAYDAQGSTVFENCGTADGSLIVDAVNNAAALHEQVETLTACLREAREALEPFRDELDARNKRRDRQMYIGDIHVSESSLSVAAAALQKIDEVLK